MLDDDNAMQLTVFLQLIKSSKYL
ncbi:hypothetical protein METHP14_150051 [Pseudomonas sp. P14-2025]